jgi:hypothetical protein
MAIQEIDIATRWTRSFHVGWMSFFIEIYGNSKIVFAYG